MSLGRGDASRSWGQSRPALFFFFFNDTATTEIYTLSLHDALPISPDADRVDLSAADQHDTVPLEDHRRASGADGHEPSRPRHADLRIAAEFHLPHWTDRKSTRLNSSHLVISYAVFCLKKKKKQAHI